MAESLNNLALLNELQGCYRDAEPIYRRTLAVPYKALGPQHPHVAVSLNNLAGLCRAQGKFAEAVPLYKRALEILGKALGQTIPMWPRP